ncbi:Protein of unknown function, partial [Gryllus bimaculatus]
MKILTRRGVGHLGDVRWPCSTSWIISSLFMLALALAAAAAAAAPRGGEGA